MAESDFYSAPTYEAPATSGVARERSAWAILVVAFVVFCLLAVGVPLSVRWYLQNAMRPQVAGLTSNAGTTLVVEHDGEVPVALPEGARKTDVREGMRIEENDTTSSSVLSLFDDSTVIVFPNSELTIEQMRAPRFRRSARPNQIRLNVPRGQIRVNVASPDSRPVAMVVETPHGETSFAEGSYSVDVSNSRTQVTVRSGAATVVGSTGEAVTLETGERSRVALNEAPTGPLPAAQNLIVNGDFRRAIAASPLTQGPLAEGWVVYNNQGGDGGAVDGTVELVSVDGRRAVRFLRTNSRNNHGETGIRQTLNKLVAPYDSLKLRFDVKLINQSLSGGGQLNSEFPLMVRVNYKDIYGNDNHLVRGFYYKNPDDFHVDEIGRQIPPDTWFQFEIPDLTSELQDPLIITSIQVYASGWDYESLVSEVGLTAE